jgi:hypothetical protein
MTSVGITGHQKVPDEAREYVRREMINYLLRLPPPIVGNSALAAGADQLFAEVVLDCGGTLHAVLPSQDYASSFPDIRAAEKFFALKLKAQSTEILDYPAPSEDAFMAAGQRVVELSEHVIAVWDGMPARGKGGTGDVVAYAHKLGRTVVVLWPEGLVRE